MSTALKTVNIHKTDQRTSARSDQVVNSAGGFVFPVTPKVRLERFLVLGVDGGTYYVNEQKHTANNAKFVIDLADSDPDLLIDTIVAVSESGRAYRNSPAIFAIAVAVSFVPETHKAKARAAVPRVCRTSTHLFEFAEYIDNLSGWGRAKRSAVANWYESKTVDQLAYQAVKYRQRNGWTHRDLMRLSHPKGIDMRVGDFMLGKPVPVQTIGDIIDGFMNMQDAKTVKQVVSILSEYKNLPWETIPTEFLKSPEVWSTLFYNNAIGGVALLRNVTRFGELGMFESKEFSLNFVGKVTDSEFIAKSRLHPIQFLLAKMNYENGGRRGGDWNRVSLVSDGLESGFYNAFGTLQPNNKSNLLAIDVSGSMAGGMVGGVENFTPNLAAATMAMVTARTEPFYEIRGFSDTFKDLGISKNSTLREAARLALSATFGRTDCALPMLWARQNKVLVDNFIIYTDNETWWGQIHPFQALRAYRKDVNSNAKLIVVGMTATNFTIADPNDAGMLDVVGFDTNAPNVIADFGRQ